MAHFATLELQGICKRLLVRAHERSELLGKRNVRQHVMAVAVFLEHALPVF